MSFLAVKNIHSATDPVTGYPDLPRPPPAIVESNFPLLPPNMRLAGKISGTGRMQALDDSDLVLQVRFLFVHARQK